ncbi:MAG: dephospho-CoA kinase [Opitutales bacterium]
MDRPWGDDKLVLGLTGGIGCGKSTLLRLFGERGWETVSADAIVGELLANDPDIAGSIGKEFGESALLPEGGVDKRVLATLVFTDSSKRRWLEELIHPFVREEWISQVSGSPRARHLVEIPLLFENHLESYFSQVVSVFCSQKIQLERLTEKGMTNEEANARISAQMPVQEKVERSDVAFFNDGDLAHLEAQLDVFLTELRQD